MSTLEPPILEAGYTGPEDFVRGFESFNDYLLHIEIVVLYGCGHLEDRVHLDSMMDAIEGFFAI